MHPKAAPRRRRILISQYFTVLSYSDSTSATISISVEEYLSTAYSPDVDYVDGMLEDRNVGEKPHSKAQRKLILLLDKASGGKICVWPEQRVQVSETRYRVVDVCATIAEPDEDIFTTPPFICIEVLSRRDTMTTIQEKLDDYRTSGVPHIWIIDPRRRKAFSYGTDGLFEIVDAFVTHSPEVVLPVGQLFD
jgi:Uma2 family endonuclease